MLKRCIIILMLGIISLHASNFRNGIIAFKKGQFYKAKIFFETAIKEDNSMNARYFLGRMYLKGKGVSTNTKKSIELLSISYKYGNIPAGCYLSRAHIQNGVNVYLAAEGVKRGIAKHIAFCEESLRLYKAYNSDVSTFTGKLKKEYLRDKKH